MIRNTLLFITIISLFTLIAFGNTPQPARAKIEEISISRNAPPLRFADARLKTGVRLRYAESGDPVGHPIILLHGYTDSWFSFSRVLPILDQSYHVYILDQRGHGDSERPRSGYTFPDFAADVIAFMDAKGIMRATLVGHSMGSFVAQGVALAAPERVERLVLIGSATTVRNQTVLEFQEAVENLGEPVPAEFAREFQVSTVHQPLPNEFMDRVVTESRKLPARVWKAVLAGMLAGDYKARLGDIRTPALIVWGDRDTFFLRAEEDALAATLPNAVLKVYPETGHCPNWERPEQFAQDLKEFITRTETSAAPASGHHHHADTTAKRAVLMSGLGERSHPVSTRNAEAQRFFDQGLALVYAFNHDEAARSFRRAAELQRSDGGRGAGQSRLRGDTESAIAGRRRYRTRARLHHGHRQKVLTRHAARLPKTRPRLSRRDAGASSPLSR
jgi:non-heme chloroperoxidase